ncbi:MAG: sulfatase [Bacteroidetes bacterium]|nr:sulfatase [Bacteroidota bacterium]
MKNTKHLAIMLMALGVHNIGAEAREQKKLVQDNKPVNILVLLTDDQRWDALGYAGNRIVKTPNLDKLASQGTYFKNAFVTTPICCASRASILTGQFARKNGVYDFSHPIKLESTYPAILRNSGYYTGFIGKWGTMETNAEYFKESADLFDYWGGSMGQSNYWHERDCNYVLNNGTTQKHNFQCNCPADKRGVSGEGIRIGHDNMKDPVHQDTYVIPHKVKQFFEQRDENKPFCLSISFKAPHGPWSDYDPKYQDNFEGIPMTIAESVNLEDALSRPDFLRISLNGGENEIKKIKTKDELNGPLQRSMREYYRLITGMDNAVGQIINELKKNGEYENTIIIFLADNGHFMDEHGFNGKWLMYDESIRVPFFVFDPRNPKRKSMSKEMVLNIDVAPTVLDIAGVPIPETMQGKSLLPLLKDPTQKFRSEIFVEHHFIAWKGEKHIERSECLRTKEWKYIRYIDQQGADSEELYNLLTDPLELKDLSEDTDSKERLRELRGRYETYFDKE